jgi:hypothetical protein
MTRIHSDGIAVTSERFIKLLREHIFMTKEGVGVRKVRIHLHSSLEELDGNVMLFLQTKAVAGCTP